VGVISSDVMEKSMKKFIKTGSRAGVFVSLTVAALIAPEVILSGPGCMNNQNMARGYSSYAPVGPQAGYYGQRMPYQYNMAPGAHRGMMAAPYKRPMSPWQSKPAAVVAQAAGADACPFTTLYRDFLSRHQERFVHHPRMALQWRNLQRIDTESLRAIRLQAESMRASF
jgi:hypothetical protein